MSKKGGTFFSVSKNEETLVFIYHHKWKILKRKWILKPQFHEQLNMYYFKNDRGVNFLNANLW